jgi:hypothetical protein
MDDASQFESEFDTESSLAEDGSSSVQYVIPASRTGGIQNAHCRYASGFSTNAKHFVVSGGKFKSVTHVHSTAPTAFHSELDHIHSTEIFTLAADFPVIPLGHINLLQEIGHHRSAGVVHRGHDQNSVRRMYSARIHGSKSKMVGALYQGDGAEEVHFGYSRPYIVFIALHSDGGRMSRDIRNFGQWILVTILIE